jgi:hypothetical protein
MIDLDDLSCTYEQTCMIFQSWLQYSDSIRNSQEIVNRSDFKKEPEFVLSLYGYQLCHLPPRQQVHLMFQTSSPNQNVAAMELATHRTVFNCLGHEVIEVFGAWF